MKKFNKKHLKNIITEIVLKFLNEARFDIPSKIPVTTSIVHDFDVPIKKSGNKINKSTKNIRTPFIHPDVMKKSNSLRKNEISDTENVPTNSESSEDPIDSQNHFDGLNMTRSV